MSKIIVAGEAVVVTSSMKLEDLKTIAKYRPDALILKGGEDGKEPIFAVSTTKGAGDINAYGACFGGETHDNEKLATITMGVGAVVDADIEEYIADKLGSAITNLNKLEEKLPEVLAEIAGEKAAVLASISIAQ